MYDFGGMQIVLGLRIYNVKKKRNLQKCADIFVKVKTVYYQMV